MAEDNILPFPNKFIDAFDEEQWQTLQGEFYLDCYHAHHGTTADTPEQLRAWLQEHQLFADLENSFFRGWLLRRLAE
jgi:hypothetical protein